MNRKEIIASFESLLRREDFLHLHELTSEAEELEAAFHHATEEYEAIEKKKFLDAGGEEDHFVLEKEAEDHRFKELENIYTDKRQKLKAERTNTELLNLDIKRKIIHDLSVMIHEEDRISKAFNEFNHLREQWKKTGPVPPKYYKQLQADYNHQIDLFFYTIKIYQDLKDLDLHKNLETKLDLIAKMKDLLKESSIHKMEDMAKALQEDWIETGPVPHDEWEKIKEEFKEASSQVYHKINEHYREIKTIQKENLSKKNQLLDKSKALLSLDLQSLKKWNEKSRELISLQKQWREIGFAQKGINEKIWKEFKEICDNFFENKRKFIDGLRQDSEKNREIKEGLIEKAKALQNSEDWKPTAEAMIKLQREWTDTGPANRIAEQKLWKQFRKACDHFFEARKKYFSTLDDRKKENADKKRQLISELGKTEKSGDQEKDLEFLRDKMTQWDTLNPVPIKEKNALESDFRKAIEKIYKEWGLPTDKLHEYRFSAKIDRLKNSNESSQLLREESRLIHDRIKKLEDTITQYENNMQFFRVSNKPNPLLNDIKSKLEFSKQEVQKLKKQLKMVKSAAR